MIEFMPTAMLLIVAGLLEFASLRILPAALLGAHFANVYFNSTSSPF